jgi:hypothetical protein
MKYVIITLCLLLTGCLNQPGFIIEHYQIIQSVNNDGRISVKGVLIKKSCKPTIYVWPPYEDQYEVNTWVRCNRKKLLLF